MVGETEGECRRIDEAMKAMSAVGAAVVVVVTMGVIGDVPPRVAGMGGGEGSAATR